MDQFTYAERATDWRSNNNIAESIFEQMRLERHPTPSWVVTSPGTGGTTATIGRYVRYRRHRTQVLCADPEHSVFFESFVTRNRDLTLNRGSGIEGIGRPRVEASFIPDVIDEMVKVPDAASLAAMHYLAGVLGRRVGGSTGTNLIGALHLAVRMQERREQGSIVGILCDGGERYAHSYYNADWLTNRGFDLAPRIEEVRACAEEGAALPALSFATR
jgi:cysteine synthase A